MSWWTYKNKFSLFTALFCSTLLSGQLPEYAVQWQEKGYNELITHEKTSYSVSLIANELEIFQEKTQESLILSALGTQSIHDYFYYSSLFPIINHHAYKSDPPYKARNKSKMTQYSDKLKNESFVFHGDLMQRKITYSGLNIGSKKHLQYKVKVLDPFLLQKHIFASNVPIKNSILTITADNEIQLDYKIFNISEADLNVTVDRKKKSTTYTWEMNDINPMLHDDHLPGFLHYAPHIVVYINSYKVNNSSKELLGKIENLGDYYRTFIDTLNSKIHPELQTLTNNLTNSSPDDIDKIKNIYYWVKDNIKYVAFESGYEGFRPRSAAQVFEQRFGDCKDMSSIIHAMASYAGIQGVHLAWIGTRDIPYGYSTIATPSVDNHMIAVYESRNTGEYVFLDATDRFSPFGIPSGFIQGKEALIYNGGDFKIVRVPEIPALKNIEADSVVLQIANSTLVGRGLMTIGGVPATYLISRLGDKTMYERKKVLRSVLEKGHNKFTLLDFTEAGLENRDESYSVHYSFSLENYLVSIQEDLIAINLFLLKPLQSKSLKKDRKLPMELDFLTFKKYTIELEIPDGYTILEIPQGDSFENDLLRFTVKYQTIHGKIILNYELETKILLVNEPQFGEWNQAISYLKKAYSNSILLTKTK